jgi:6-phosphogluconate dehydrogenase
VFLIVMGVAGIGKTTIGRLLASHLNWPFYEADDYHPARNLLKMSRIQPLDDDNRHPWLDSLAEVIRSRLLGGGNGVMACSALKDKYRQLLCLDGHQVKFIYLAGSYAEILPRLQNRRDHFMKPEMLASQFAALEEPVDAIKESILLPPEKIIDNILEKIMDQKKSLGIMGLGVMGRSLALNFERHGMAVAGYDVAPRDPADYPYKIAVRVEDLAASLKLPRVILMMVPAGSPVDIAIASVKPFLQPGDILIDGGNSYFEDTNRRVGELQESGIRFVGMGVSGGEQGALWGPSLMPGGDTAAWPVIQPMVEAIAARAEDGQPCAAWIGPSGAGHYVKMVHNGIEYADMQLIAEIYDLLHRGAGINNEDLARVFDQWNHGVLRSYLIEITAHILSKLDPETGTSLIDQIVDEAGQKGTGMWASENALQAGVAVPSITAAVESRYLSGLRAERRAASELLGRSTIFEGDRKHLVEIAEAALFASKVTAYAQGLSLLRAASLEHKWNLNLAAILRIWRAGCIIRADILNQMAAAFESTPDLPSLLLDDYFREGIQSRQAAWREVIQTGIGLGIPLPGSSAAVAYFDAYRSARLPANLIQAQRDYFGAHTYRRLDQNGIFHTEWGEKPVQK